MLKRVIICYIVFAIISSVFMWADYFYWERKFKKNAKTCKQNDER